MSWNSLHNVLGLGFLKTWRVCLSLILMLPCDVLDLRLMYIASCVFVFLKLSPIISVVDTGMSHNPSSLFLVPCRINSSSFIKYVFVVVDYNVAFILKKLA